MSGQKDGFNPVAWENIELVDFNPVAWESMKTLQKKLDFILNVSKVPKRSLGAWNQWQIRCLTEIFSEAFKNATYIDQAQEIAINLLTSSKDTTYKDQVSMLVQQGFSSISDKDHRELTPEHRTKLSAFFNACNDTLYDDLYGSVIPSIETYEELPLWQQKEWILRFIKERNFIELDTLPKSSLFYQCIFEQHEELSKTNDDFATTLKGILDNLLKNNWKRVRTGNMDPQTWNELPAIQQTTLLSQLIQEENADAIKKIIPLLSKELLSTFTLEQNKVLLDMDPDTIFKKLPLDQQKAVVSGLIKVLLDMDPDTIFKELPLDQQKAVVSGLINDSETIPGSQEALKGLLHLFSGDLFNSLSIEQIKKLLSIEPTSVFSNMPVQQQTEVVSRLIMELDAPQIEKFFPYLDEDVFTTLTSDALIKLRGIYQEKIIDLLPSKEAYDAVLKTFTDQDDKTAFISAVQKRVGEEFSEKTNKNIITPAWKVALLEPSDIAAVKSRSSQQQADSAPKTSILPSIKSASKMIGYSLWSLMPGLNYVLAKNIGDLVDEIIFNNTGIGKWAARICSFIPGINLLGFFACAAALKLEAKANGVLTDAEIQKTKERKKKGAPAPEVDFEARSQQLLTYFDAQYDKTFIGTFEHATKSKEQVSSVFSWVKRKLSGVKESQVDPDRLPNRYTQQKFSHPAHNDTPSASKKRPYPKGATPTGIRIENPALIETSPSAPAPKILKPGQNKAQKTGKTVSWGPMADVRTDASSPQDKSAPPPKPY